MRAGVKLGLGKQHHWQTSSTGIINPVFHLSKEKVLTKEFVGFSKSGRKKKNPPSFSPAVINKMSRKLGGKKKNKEFARCLFKGRHRKR